MIHTHIVNHLNALTKTFANKCLKNKVLICLNRNRQPKITDNYRVNESINHNIDNFVK